MKEYFSGWIKPGNYGTEILDNIEYVITYTRWQRYLRRVIKFIQLTLWKYGIAIHDPIFGECTPDFNCCTDLPNNRKTLIRWCRNGKTT